MTIGFIGMGNMAQAIAGGWRRAGAAAQEELLAYAPHQDKLRANARKIGFTPVQDAVSLVRRSDVILLACKPYQLDEVLGQLVSARTEDGAPILAGKALVSIALGWNFERLSAAMQDTGDVRLQFIMPNTPAAIGEGVFLFEQEHSLTEKERERVWELFSLLGRCFELPARLMGIGGAVSGCGPAFVDLFLEAFADAAVKYGLPRQTAYELVSLTVAGSARLQLATGEHPGALKDAVCSPAGSTIRGVAALEKGAFRAVCMSAIDAVMEK